ncbi:MAG: DUF4874 domain-containing protein [Clostridia bacterium]|nr:DUF4874 domain-containing protein [Clostridia bacterium]
MEINFYKELKPLTSEGDSLLFDNPDRAYRTHMVMYAQRAVDSGNPMEYYQQVYDNYYARIKVPCHGCMAYFYLTEYRGMDIPDEAMEAMEKFYDFCELKDFKVMLRFAYCDDLNFPERGADEETIIRHIKQLAPMIARNKKYIHSVEGGFIGSYGEWASCYQKPEVNYANVAKALMRYLCEPNGIYLSLRLPEYKNLIEKTNPYYSKIAVHNDSMYGEQDKWESGGFIMGTPQWQQLCEEGAYTPQGGELNCGPININRNIWPTGLEVIKEAAHHWQNTMSILHGLYDGKGGEPIPEENYMPTMWPWKSEPITPEILEENKIAYCPSWFKDEKGNDVERVAFDFMRDHLGYKVELQSVAVAGENEPDSYLSIELKLKNYGMSAAFCLKSGFVLLDGDNNVVSSVEAGNPEKWYSHNPEDYLDTKILTHKVQAVIKTPENKGHYKLCFYLKNDMERYARLSNNIDAIGGYHLLYEFDI